jgi:succinylglutamate desuccinylase
MTTTVTIAFFVATPPQKKMMTHCHCAIVSSSQTHIRQNTQENNQKNEEKGGAYLQAPTLPSLLVPTSTLSFYPFDSSVLS